MQHSFKDRFVSGVLSFVIAVVFVCASAVPGLLKGQNVLADAPQLYDSASQINYASVLGGAVDYGIVANKINHGNTHSEMTFATNEYNSIGNQNNDVDFIDGTAHFIIGKVSDGSYPLRLGNITAQSLYLEAPSDFFGAYAGKLDDVTAAGTYGNVAFNSPFFNLSRFTPEHHYHPAIIEAVNNNARTNVDRLINRISRPDTGRSAELNAKATNPAYQLPEEYYDLSADGKKLVINIDEPEFVDKVVYINMTSKMLKAWAATSGIEIYKDPSTVVVFNVTQDAVNGEYGADGVLVANKYEVYTNGEKIVSTTAPYGNKNEKYDGSTVDYTGVDEQLCQKVIWNVLATNDVSLNMMAGTMLFPNSSHISLDSGNISGWLVTGGEVDVNIEFHYIYQGGSDDTKGQMHFSLNKAVTKEYADKDTVVRDTSVDIHKGDFKFFLQEYSDNTYTSPVGERQEKSNDELGMVYLPKLTFHTYASELTPAEQAISGDYHVITLPTSTQYDYIDPDTNKIYNLKTFYYKITEDPATTVLGIENSNGYVEIELNVYVDEDGNFTYKPKYKAVTGDDIVFDEPGVEIPMSGVQFDIGAFYNRELKKGELKIEKQVVGAGSAADGMEYKIAVKTTIDGTDYYVVNEDGELSKTKTYLTVKAGAANAVTIKNLLEGVYTFEEDTDSAKIYGYDLSTPTFTPSSCEIKDEGEQKSTTVVNTYTKDDSINTGELSITKSVTGYTGDDEYTIYVKQNASGKYLSSLITGELGEQPTPFTFKAGETLTFKNVPLITWDQAQMLIHIHGSIPSKK